MREAVLKRHPEVAEVLNRLAGRIDDRTMRKLNYQVAVEKRSEAEVGGPSCWARGCWMRPNDRRPFSCRAGGGSYSPAIVR